MDRIIIVNGVPYICHKEYDMEVLIPNKKGKFIIPGNLTKIQSPYDNRRIYIQYKECDHDNDHYCYNTHNDQIFKTHCLFTGTDIKTGEKWVMTCDFDWYKEYTKVFSDESEVTTYISQYENRKGIIEFHFCEASLVSARGKDGNRISVVTTIMGRDTKTKENMVYVSGNWYEMLDDTVNINKDKVKDNHSKVKVDSKVQKFDSVNKNQRVYHAKSIKNQVDKKYIFPVKNIIANMAKWIYSQDPINHSTNYPVHKIYISEILHLLYMNLIKDGRKLEIPADEDFYYFEYTKEELRKYLYSLVYDKPETKEFFSKLNLSYNEMKNGIEVSDPNRNTINLSSRFSGPKWEDDFIDLDALINNVVLECVKDAVAAE